MSHNSRHACSVNRTTTCEIGPPIKSKDEEIVSYCRFSYLRNYSFARNLFNTEACSDEIFKINEHECKFIFNLEVLEWESVRIESLDLYTKKSSFSRLGS